MTDINWAGRGFTAAPGSYPELWQDLRAVLRNNGPLTLNQVQELFRGVPRRTLISELARMRDDGEVRFEGPRYVLAGQPPAGRCAEHSMDGPEHDWCRR